MVAIGGAAANGLRYDVPQNATATITLTEAPGSADKRMVTADVRINPPDLISDDPNWVSVLGWQGGLAERARHLRRPPGEARARPLPLHPADAGMGLVEDAAAGARRQDLTAVPIYLAADPGIGAPEVPAAAVDDPTVRLRDHHPAA